MMTDREPAFHVPSPDPNPVLAARVVRGHNLGFIRDGWLVYYYDLGTLPATIDDEGLYVVLTEDARHLVRRLRHAPAPGRFDLFTATGPVELDVKLEWAQAIVWIKPFKPSDDQWAQLEAAG